MKSFDWEVEWKDVLVAMGAGVILALLVIAGSGCGGGHKPPPQPPQPPQPPVEECLPDLKWCKDLPSPKCGPCKTNPTTDPAYCERFDFPACKDEMCLPDANDAGWGQPVPPAKRPFTPLIRQHILEVLQDIGDRCGKPPMETLSLIANELKARGWCSEVMTDSVAVKAPDKYVEEWHLVYFGNGCTVTGPGAYKNAWPHTSDPPSNKYDDEPDSPDEPDTPPEPPAPPPTPPPSGGGCPSPDPPPLNKWNCHRHGKGWNCTPYVYSPGGKYCLSVGYHNLGDPTTGRLNCPVRMEGAPDREPCEEKVVKGKPKWKFPPGANCWGGWKDNPYLAVCKDGARPKGIEICDAEGKHCSRVE